LNRPQSYDVLIIGAGLSGLAAGIRLAHFGKKVAILERHDRVGGLNSYYTMNGRELDVGLHAITNLNPNNGPFGAMKKVLRQLRLKAEDFDLHPHNKSLVTCHGTNLEFTNEFDYFVSQINDTFPGERDNFQKLLKKMDSMNLFDYGSPAESSREILGSTFGDPHLAEMLLLPAMFYGNSREDDMEFRQFAILFNSIFREGIGRPRNGIRPILDVLVKRFTESGGKLMLESGVMSIITENKKAVSVTLYDGRILHCDSILSSAGHPETIALLAESGASKVPEQGRISFMESLSVLDRPTAEIGFEYGIVFYSLSEKLSYRRPDTPVDTSSGVICLPDNFAYPEPLDSRMVRITNIADHRFWEKIDPMKNLPEKNEWYKRSLKDVSAILPDISGKTVFTDIFTPRTIERYTGRFNGAVYGAPVKLWDGCTDIPNIFICGTDQGFLGIVGSMLSGISIANDRLLK